MQLNEIPEPQQRQIQALREHLSDVQRAIVEGADPVALALHQIYAPLLLQAATKIEILTFQQDVLEKALTALRGPVEADDSPAEGV